MSFIETIKQRAKQDIKTIVLPEGNDIRTIEGAKIALEEGYANIILLGNEEEITKTANKHNFDISKAKIINPLNSPNYDEFVNSFYELRKNKGMTIEKAKEIIKDETYFGMMMVKQGLADGLVSGAVHSTADTLRPALQILKTAPGTKLVSAFFLMVVPDCQYGENGTFIFSDSGLNEYPDAESLSEIAISSSQSFRKLVGKEPKVAMLSYSTYGSATSTIKEKVVEATKILKAPGSPVKGQANTLIFPDLDAGNIGYKLVQRLAKAEAYGPLCQGIAKPVNDLSRGCSSQDIAGVIAITAVQGQE